MKIIQKQLLWLLSVLLITVTACNSKTDKEEKPPLIAVEDFFKNADKTGWQISSRWGIYLIPGPHTWAT